MRNLESAFELLGAGESGLFICTDGTNLKIRGSKGESGWWVLNPERPFDRVFIFKRNDRGSGPHEVYAARCTHFEGPDERRYRLMLEDVRLEGTTLANWRAFALGGQNPIRYLEGNEPIPEQVDDPGSLPEGATYRVTVNAYERNAKARRRCLEHHGTTCCICRFNFVDAYGEAAEGIIHVHHLRPLSEIGAEYEVDPVADLRPVCPNCHAVLHRRVPPYAIEEVRAFLSGRVLRAVDL